MPKSSEWEKLPKPQTLQQRSAYLDACVQWLVRDEPVKTPTVLVGSMSHIQVSTYSDNILHNDEDLNLPVRRKCGLCDREGSHVMLANPFSLRCQMFLCGVCASFGGESTH
jgi:hypothetical protein